MKVIGVIGSRMRDSKEDFELVKSKIAELWEIGDYLCSGGCSSGADYFAEIIAKKACVPIKIHYANWKRYGRSAGFIRNGDIAEESDILIACVAEDRTGGTEDTIKKFLKDKQEEQLYLI